ARYIFDVEGEQFISEGKAQIVSVLDSMNNPWEPREWPVVVVRLICTCREDGDS
ncbi:hypothetical protein HAX54_007707, partial [Datura stramonium]|nr:hypothetical protein [Datura stramonium]